MSNQNLARLGELITLRRAQLGITGTAKLAELSGAAKRTIDAIIGQENVPQPVTQRRLEAALGWWTGSIAELLKAADPSAFTLDGMATGDVPEPATRASELTDDELFIEISHRMRDWRAWVDRQDRPAVVVDPVPDLFGLAANRSDEEPGDEEEV